MGMEKWERSERTGTKSVNFKSVDLSIHGIAYDSVSGDGSTDTGGKIVHLVCEVALTTDGSHDGRCGVQVSGEHHVGWDEELINRPNTLISSR